MALGAGRGPRSPGSPFQSPDPPEPPALPPCRLNWLQLARLRQTPGAVTPAVGYTAGGGQGDHGGGDTAAAPQSSMTHPRGTPRAQANRNKLWGVHNPPLPVCHIWATSGSRYLPGRGGAMPGPLRMRPGVTGRVRRVTVGTRRQLRAGPGRSFTPGDLGDPPLQGPPRPVTNRGAAGALSPLAEAAHPSRPRAPACHRGQPSSSGSCSLGTLFPCHPLAAESQRSQGGGHAPAPPAPCPWRGSLQKGAPPAQGQGTRAVPGWDAGAPRASSGRGEPQELDRPAVGTDTSP